MRKPPIPTTIPAITPGERLEPPVTGDIDVDVVNICVEDVNVVALDEVVVVDVAVGLGIFLPKTLKIKLDQIIELMYVDRVPVMDVG